MKRGLQMFVGFMAVCAALYFIFGLVGILR
jgi:hypothetical protein